MEESLPNLLPVDESLVIDTFQRLSAGASQLGYEIKYSGVVGNAFQELYPQLVSILVQVEKQDRQKFFRLLYTVDIAEHKLRNMMAKFPNLNRAQVTAYLWIEREFQKVVTRRIFKKP